MMKTDSKRRVRQQASAPGLDLENEGRAAGARLIAGVDEAGRGPWAGPVVAAAVILDEAALPEGIADSKALSAQMREVAAERIRAVARVGVGIADVARIDRDNILNATHWAMAEAVRDLGQVPCLVLVDGNRLPRLPCGARAVVKGDAISLSIAAASIIAKVTRDAMMAELAHAHPEYGFERHKGYGTAEHRAALERFGPCPHHRRSFRPVQIAAAGKRQ